MNNRDVKDNNLRENLFEKIDKLVDYFDINTINEVLEDVEGFFVIHSATSKNGFGICDADKYFTLRQIRKAFDPNIPIEKIVSPA